MNCIVKYFETKYPWLRISHFKIILLGLTATFTISGLYSAFAHVQKLYVMDREYFMDFFGLQTNLWYGEPIHGLVCVPHASNKYTSETCDDLAKYLYYNTTNTHYQCASTYYVDLSTKTLFDISHHDILYKTFLALSISSGFYAVYAIIHDLGGIYYKEHLNEMVYYPKYGSLYSIAVYPVFNAWLDSEWNWLLLPLGIIVFPPLLIVDIIILSAKYPVYISSFIVGISRAIMGVCAGYYVAQTLGFVTITAEQSVDTKCDCSCYLYLPQSNTLTCLFATILLMIINASFLKKWYCEAKYEAPIFYLVSFTLPFKIANNLQTDNMALGYNFRNPGTFNSVSGRNINVANTDHSGYDLLSIEIDCKSDVGSDSDIEWDVITRKYIYVWTAFMEIIYIGGSLIVSAVLNHYEYYNAVRIIFIIVGLLIVYAAFKKKVYGIQNWRFGW